MKPIKTKFAYQIAVRFKAETPIARHSGEGDNIVDNLLSKTPNGDFYVNGMAWVNLMRRGLNRLSDNDAKTLAKEIGDHDEDKFSFSPLICYGTKVKLSTTEIRPGNRHDRWSGTVAAGALFNEELTPPGITLDFHCTYLSCSGWTPCQPDLTSAKQNNKNILQLLLNALWVIDSGIETLGGGWAYGYGHLKVQKVLTRKLDLTNAEDRKLFNERINLDINLSCLAQEKIEDKATKILCDDKNIIDSSKQWTKITLTGKIADGHLLAISSDIGQDISSIPPGDNIPDSFVYRRITADGKWQPVLLGRSLRQKLFRVPIERELNTFLRSQQSQDTNLENPKPKTQNSKLSQGELICNLWFGDGEHRGYIRVEDAVIYKSNQDKGKPENVFLQRIALCEHSFKNMNMFLFEYLKEGEFKIKVIIDYANMKDEADKILDIFIDNNISDKELTEKLNLKEAIGWAIKQMGYSADGESKAPPGWTRLGGQSTSCGGIKITYVKKLPELSKSVVPSTSSGSGH